MDNMTLQRINALRKDMEAIAEQNNYNFQHPAVLLMSAELDLLITEYMKCTRPKKKPDPH